MILSLIYTRQIKTKDQDDNSTLINESFDYETQKNNKLEFICCQEESKLNRPLINKHVYFYLKNFLNL